MIEALLITLASLLVGGAIAALASRGHALLDVLRTFAVTAVATLAAVQLLPESVERLGAWALLLFLGALALPPVFASIARRLRRAGAKPTGHGIGAELGYFGFVAHQFVEGLALATYANPETYDHDHVGLVLVVAAHTVPMTALFIGSVLRHRGPRPAVRRVLALLAASTAGFFTADWVTSSVADAVAPTLAALVAGFLCHVLLHGVGVARPRSPAVRLLDLAAVAAGIALPFASIHTHSVAAEHLNDALSAAWVELAIETAPMLLIGLVLGALLQLAGSRIPGRWLHSGSASRQALRGIAIGAPLPLCACGVLPLAEGLRRRGAGAALVVAFLISTPELGPETLTLSVRFLGWPYAVLRIASAVLVAYLAGVAFGWLADRARVNPAAAPAAEQTSLAAGPVARPIRSMLSYLDELLLHTAPWTVVGLLAAAYIEVSFAPDALAPLAASGMDVFVLALVALPTYVCASSATPMAAVLMLKGVSPGAVLVGLLLGPATNIATVAVLGRAYGHRTAWLGVGIIAAIACALGMAVNAIGVPVQLPADLGAAHGHSVASWAAAAILAGLLLGQLWRWGLGPWLMILDAGGHAHAHGADAPGNTGGHDSGEADATVDHHHDHHHHHHHHH